MPQRRSGFLHCINGHSMSNTRRLIRVSIAFHFLELPLPTWLIMLMTHRPTDPTTVIEFTDWQQVEAFGRRIDELGRT